MRNLKTAKFFAWWILVLFFLGLVTKFIDVVNDVYNGETQSQYPEFDILAGIVHFLFLAILIIAVFVGIYLVGRWLFNALVNSLADSYAESDAGKNGEKIISVMDALDEKLKQIETNENSANLIISDCEALSTELVGHILGFAKRAGNYKKEAETLDLVISIMSQSLIEEVKLIRLIGNFENQYVANMIRNVINNPELATSTIAILAERWGLMEKWAGEYLAVSADLSRHLAETQKRLVDMDSQLAMVAPAKTLAKINANFIEASNFMPGKRQPRSIATVFSSQKMLES